MKKTNSIPLPHHPARLLFPLLIALLFFTGYRTCQKIQPFGGTSGGPPRVNPSEPGGGVAVLSLREAPRHVRRMVEHLKSVRHFQPPRYYKGARVFRNLEGTLPRGRKYYEYDLHPNLPGVARNGERLVVDQQKQFFYYTKDHYRTFTQIK